MSESIKNIRMKEEGGYVMVAVLLFMVLLTVIGVAATQTSTFEIEIAGNERAVVDDFYQTEAVLTDTIEDYRNWLTDKFLTDGETVANFTGNVDFDGDGNDDAYVEIRCIEDTETDVADLSTAANDIPKLSHVGPAPPDSMYSVDKFEIRRYGLTTSSPDDHTVVQAGIWMAFNKF